MLTTLTQMQKQLDMRPHLLGLGRLFSHTVLLQLDEDAYYLKFDQGRLADITPGLSRKIPWRFAIRTDAEAMDQFWGQCPAPGFHDLFGLVKIGRAEIDGDILELVKNLRFFKEFMALGREVQT